MDVTPHYLNNHSGINETSNFVVASRHYILFHILVEFQSINASTLFNKVHSYHVTFNEKPHFHNVEHKRPLALQTIDEMGILYLQGWSKG